MPPAKILIVDDDYHCRNLIATALSKFSYQIDMAENGREATDLLENKPYDLILCDLMMPKIDGMGVLEHFNKKNPAGNFVLISAHGTIEKAVEAMKEGAYDFLVKPINIKQLYMTINKALESARLRRQNKKMREELQEKGLPAIIGQSHQFKEILQLTDRIADSDSTALITGPSGSGKELIAKRIHYKSSRLGNPLMIINCAAIPSNLLESQFFGYIQGAFTGAESTRNGIFHQANEGTLFMDEIGELDPNMQVKLLRAIQEGEIRKVGSTETEKVDIRFIAATNRDLQKEVANGQFREDLFYRLNVINIKLPSLKERIEDLPLLVEHFIEKYNTILGKNVVSFNNDFIRSLSNYDFPGNIRELENIIQKAMILCDKDQLTSDLLTQKGGSFSPEDQEGLGSNVMGLHEMIENLEKETITKALHMFNGNHSKVAKYLKIPRSTLYKKLNDYQIRIKKI